MTTTAWKHAKAAAARAGEREALAADLAPGIMAACAAGSTLHSIADALEINPDHLAHLVRTWADEHGRAPVTEPADRILREYEEDRKRRA